MQQFSDLTVQNSHGDDIAMQAFDNKSTHHHNESDSAFALRAMPGARQKNPRQVAGNGLISAE